MTEFWQTFANSVVLAPVYFFTAVGFVLIYRATRVFNFAQGAYMLLGADLLYQFSVKWSFPIVLAILAAAAATMLIGALTYILALRPLTGQPLFSLIIVTMGLSIVATGVSGVIWGFSSLEVTMPSVGSKITIGGVHVSAFDLWTLIVGLVFLAAVLLFFRFTSTGLKMRATAESATLASRRGVRVQYTYTLAWALAGLAAAVGGEIVAFNNGVSPAISDIGLLAFPAALLGGFDSIPGAAIGGLAIALVQNYTVLWIGAGAEDVVVYGLMLLVLVVRPFGFLGTREIGRV